MPHDDHKALVNMLWDYFYQSPTTIELSALEVLQRAHLSTKLKKQVRLSDLRNALDGLVDQKFLKVRSKDGVRLYSMT